MLSSLQRCEERSSHCCMEFCVKVSRPKPYKRCVKKTQSHTGCASSGHHGSSRLSPDVTRSEQADFRLQHWISMDVWWKGAPRDLFRDASVVARRAFRGRLNCVRKCCGQQPRMDWCDWHFAARSQRNSYAAILGGHGSHQ